MSREDVERMRRWQAGEEYTWRLTVKPADTPIGSVACSFENHRAGLGFVVSHQHWGKGYATEAARALVDWALAQPQVETLVAGCDRGNAPSIHILERLGFVRTGETNGQIRWRLQTADRNQG